MNSSHPAVHVQGIGYLRGDVLRNEISLDYLRAQIFHLAVRAIPRVFRTMITIAVDGFCVGTVPRIAIRFCRIRRNKMC